jgi:hypothetical protein
VPQPADNRVPRVAGNRSPRVADNRILPAPVTRDRLRVLGWQLLILAVVLVG